MTDKEKIKQPKELLREHLVDLSHTGEIDGCGKCSLCERTVAALEDG